MRFLFTTALLFLSVCAQAAPITWTLDGVTLDDGTALTGSFDYDAATNIYSNVWISAEDEPWIDYSDSVLGGFTLDNSFGPGSATSFEAWTRYDFFPDHYLYIDLDSAMTNSGGVISVSTTSNVLEGFPPDNIFETRYVVGGTVSAVPIPAAAWLFGSALAGLGWAKRKRIAQN